MEQIKYLFFDCMETIIDLYELPSEQDYALWIYSNSGVENYWQGFEDFLQHYEQCKQEFLSLLPKNKEYNTYDLIRSIVDKNKLIKTNEMKKVTDQLFNNYWDTYKSKCYVNDSVKKVLEDLSKNYNLAIVSNFKVCNGIEELISINGIRHLFEFIVTSIGCGWRKPDSKIYEYSIKKSNAQIDQIVFIGDDYVNDYVTPNKLGIKSIFYDKEDKHTNKNKITDFKEIKWRIK